MAQRSSRGGKSETPSSGDEEVEILDEPTSEENPPPKASELAEKAKSPSEELEEVARAVLRGEYGTGQERRRLLSAAGYNARDVEREVVRLANRM